MNWNLLTGLILYAIPKGKIKGPTGSKAIRFKPVPSVTGPIGPGAYEIDDVYAYMFWIRCTKLIDTNPIKICK